MLGLILAGGSGSRLGLGEKPLVRVCNQPMLWYVIRAFVEAGEEVFVVTTRRTPYTANWCRAQGIETVRTGGAGYIDDIAEAATLLDLDAPFFTCGADLPCLTETVIRSVASAHQQSGLPACSTWVPVAHRESRGYSVHSSMMIDQTLVTPAGLNILDGSMMDREQEELQLICADPALVCNVNTRGDLLLAETDCEGPSLSAPHNPTARR
ncbi:NTP transferase domain-containing protein [Methanosphaerula subterraneus]|uniref:NTP transferase domain-containing protein n=1 Tax=Methanosphaerula subterraneus TaxID=3350244 RepID=UPI003F84A972